MGVKVLGTDGSGSNTGVLQGLDFGKFSSHTHLEK